MKKIYLILFLNLFYFAAFAQVSGTITDAETGEALIAATIQVEGTSNGTLTDIDGNFTIDAEADQILLISYLGYISQSVPVNIDNLTIALIPDNNALDQIVVIGYGEMQAKDLTSAITTIQSEELEKTPSGNVLQGLQGKAAGLQVISAGAPGSQPQIRLRGVGSYNSGDASPLYVVDGMFYNNIDFLNNSDIESVSVLKDASAVAIYGNRGANGVIIIETKSGYIDGPTSVSFDSYYGTQVARDVLKMANTEQFVQMVSELNPATSPDYQFVLEAMQRYGRSRTNPNLPNVNTDWYDEIIKPAPIQNYNLGISGGSEEASYSLGGSYFNQEGILNMDHGYKRYNARAKIDFQAYDWLKIGGNAIISNAEKKGAQTGAWRSAYYAVPILPKFDTQTEGVFPIPLSSAQYLGYRGGQNPFPQMEFNDNGENLRKILTNFYVDVSIIPDKLNFKSTYNQSFEALEFRSLNFPYFISAGSQNNTPQIGKNWTNIDNKIWNNQLTFDTDFGKSDLTLMAGTAYEDYTFQSLNATAQNFPVNQTQAWYIDQAEDIVEGGVGDGGAQSNQMSYFSRASYKFDNKYILYGTARYDGTSKFQETWIFSPAFGAAWVASEEDFFKSENIDFLKLRAGWGKVPNGNVGGSTGTNTIGVGTTALNGQMFPFYRPSIAYDSIGWEFVQETNIGLTMDALQNRLTTDVDYFIRNTKDAIIPVLVPFVGSSVRRNVGEIRNQGLEFTASWSDDLSKDLDYTISGNFATLNNQVTNLFGQPYRDAGTAEFRQRSYEGEPIFSFYGYETDGVYQNQAEIDADPIALANGLVPGDYRFKDLDGDMDVDGDDRKILGSYLPTLTWGGNIGLTFKNISFSSSFYGQSGNKILNRKRGEYIYTNDTNIDAELAENLWRGEGTSDKYPSADGLRKSWNQKMSNYYIEDGSFFRVQNLNLAYQVNSENILGGKFPRTVITATADRPFTFFKYNGFNPEVGDGIDTQTYPIPAVYTIGLKLDF